VAAINLMQRLAHIAHSPGEKIVPTLAGLYLQAFQREKQIFPYFERVQ